MLVSEVMLQQTQVTTVLRYYGEWMRRFPDVGALARAPERDVLHAWQGLGYYARARRLHAAAKALEMQHGGRLPATREELERLPGLGAYTAGAVASIAFGEREPVVDGNVVRVLTRLFGLRGDPARAPLKARLWALARELVPAARPGDFNQALMELGATVCTPRAPACERCPVSRRCAAKRDGLVERLPELAARAAPTAVRTAAVIVRRRSAVLVAEQPRDAPRWAGLFTFPFVELARGETPEAGAQRAAREAGLSVRVGARMARLEHTITRHHITLEAHEATVVRGRPRVRYAFHELEEFSELAMPSPHRRLARLVATEGERA